jgi:hypothetical protein
MHLAFVSRDKGGGEIRDSECHHAAPLGGHRDCIVTASGTGHRRPGFVWGHLARRGVGSGVGRMDGGHVSRAGSVRGDAAHSPPVRSSASATSRFPFRSVLPTPRAKDCNYHARKALNNSLNLFSSSKFPHTFFIFIIFNQ